MREMTRREILAAGGLLAAGLIISRDDETAIAPGSTTTDARQSRIRPIAGGSAISDTDSMKGTLAGGVTGPDGEPCALTNRHIIDEDFCSGSKDHLLGREVYQPSKSDGFGTVLDVGETGGQDSEDWALVEISDSDDWSSHVLGIGNPAGTTSVELGDRVVMSGLVTGLIGGEVIGLDVSKKFFGCHFHGLIQYSVDENADTNGNSGSFVGVIDENDELQIVGIHSFGDSSGRYAVPIDRVLSHSGATIESSASEPVAPESSGFCEGTIFGYDGENASCVCANVGGYEIERTVQTLDQDHDVIDETTVTLEPLEREFLTLDSDDTVILNTEDIQVEVVLA